MSYILSVDGGGSKTTYCLYNIERKEKFYFKGKSTNYKNIGARKTKENIQKGIEKIFKENNLNKEEIKFYVFGLAGCDTDNDYRMFREILNSLKIFKDKSIIMNDAKLAYKSIYSNEEGCILASGTGSIGFVFLKNKQIRLGGWGSEFSDLGSGYWIGKKFLEKYLLYLEGLEEDEIFKKFNKDLSEPEMIINEYKNVTKIASVAKFVIENYNKSLICKNIVNEAINELSKIVLKMIKIINKEKINLVISGSIASNKIIYKNILKKVKKVEKNREILFNINNSDLTEGGIKIAFDHLK